MWTSAIFKVRYPFSTQSLISKLVVDGCAKQCVFFVATRFEPPTWSALPFRRSTPDCKIFGLLRPDSPFSAAEEHREGHFTAGAAHESIPKVKLQPTRQRRRGNNEGGL